MERSSLDALRFAMFKQRYADGEFGQQRFGQAFHDAYSLYKFSFHKELLDKLWEEKDTDKAMEIVNSIFRIE